jgi:hypothetical protein
MRRGLLLVVLALAVTPAPALETDQFYAWKRPLTDAREAVNAKINAEIAEALARVNARGRPCPCDSVRRAIRHRFTYVLFQKPEIWAIHTATIDRIPATADEEELYREQYLYGGTSQLDSIRFMPPSPTILVNGVRIGTDKLSHFTSVGAWMFLSYKEAMRKGESEADAVVHAMEVGMSTERTILGGSSSGVMSLADIEANYHGLVFWKSLCGGSDPRLELTASGWRLKRPFDIGPYVTPEWDESWQPSVYKSSRWKKVKPVMARYCADLHDPAVEAQRAAYARADRFTLSERILARLVAKGEMKEPAAFTIEAACGLPLRAILPPPPVAGGDGRDAAPVPGEEISPGEE